MRWLLGAASSLGFAVWGAVAACEEPRVAPKPSPTAPKLVPGTQVSLVAPEGFTPAKRFAGFEATELGASILVNVIPAPYAEMAASMTEEAMARSGMKLLERQKLDVAGGSGLLLRAEQTAHKARYAKWLVLFGDETRTVQLVANFPAHRIELSEPLRTCLAGARWDRELAVDPYAHLPFTLECPPELKFFAQLQNHLLFTRTGRKRESPDDPTFTVGPSISSPQIPDVSAFAERRLRQLPQFKVEEVLSSKSIRTARLDGWEVLAKVSDAESGASEHVYLVVLLDAGGYYLMFGASAYAARETYLPVFRKFTASFRLRATPSRQPSDGK